MTMRFIWIFVLPSLLAACVSGQNRPAELARFDLGPAAANGEVLAAGIRGIDVTPPPWLGSSRMQYRLLYADPARRLSYAESAWAAPPADLLAQSLTLRLAAAGVGNCRLHVKLDEFVQVFDSPTDSRFVLEGRVNLVAGASVIASHGFALAQPAVTADATGGVSAAAAAGRLLQNELADWLRPYLSSCQAR